MSAPIIAASEMAVTGYEAGVWTGVRGGIDQYRPGGFNDRPVSVNIGVAIPGTSLKACRHAEACLATGVSGSNVLSVNDGSLLVVGNKIAIVGVNRMLTVDVFGPATSGGTVTVTVNGEDYAVSVSNGASSYDVANALRSAIAGFAPATVDGGGNPYFHSSTHAMAGIYYKDFNITSVSINWGGTGLSGYPNVRSATNYNEEIIAIAGNNVTVVNPVGTSFSAQVLNIDNAEVLNAAIAATAANHTCYLPPGLYVLSSGLNGRSNVTLRGGGSFIQSKASVTIGLGVKTFSDVVEGIDYEVGVGVRIERRQLSDFSGGAKIWMQGRVVSYAGGVLQVNVTSTDGAHVGATIADWRISVTMLLYDGNGTVIGMGGATEPDTFAAVYPTSPMARGDDSFDVATGQGGNFTVGFLVEITILGTHGSADLVAGKVPTGTLKGYGRLRQHTAVITDITGDTITFDPPISFACPSELIPWARRYTGTPISKSGVESIAVRGRNVTGASALVGMSCAIDCWFYDLEAMVTNNYGMGMFNCVYSEFNRTWTGWRTGAGSNGAGILAGHCMHCLFVDVITDFIDPGFEVNDGCVACAIVCSYTRTWIDVNHAGQNQFNLIEGNDCDTVISDGYHGGSNNDIIHRNRVIYRILLKRFTRNDHIALNLVGNPGAPYPLAGTITLGQPYMGAESHEGDVEPSAGTNWPELAVGYIGTITNRISESTVEVTMSADAGLWRLNNILGTAWWDKGSYSWPPGMPFGSVPVPCGFANNVNLNSRVGSVWNLTTSEGTWPALGTVLRLWPGSGDDGGFRQLDHDVANSSPQKGNNQVLGASSTWNQQSVPVGDVAVASYAYPTRPAWFPVELAWPPFDANSSATSADGRIPASIRLTQGNGVLPFSGSAPAAPSALSATVISSSRIDLSWTNGASAAVKVYRGLVSGALSLIATLPAGTTSYAAIGLDASTHYFFQVRAYSEGGYSDPSNEANGTTSAAPVGNNIPALRSSRAPRYAIPAH